MVKIAKVVTVVKVVKAPRGNSLSAQPRKPDPAWNFCRQFLKGSCTYGDECKYPHKSQAEVDELRKSCGGGTPNGAPRSDKGSGKGKGKRRGKKGNGKGK